jgi:hypothetical protein
MGEMTHSDAVRDDPFAHLRRQAIERADRTVERMRLGIAALSAAGQKITAESLKRVTHDLEPGFAGLSFQVIRRNPRAYALYREAASAFGEHATTGKQPRARRRRRHVRGAGLDKKELARRVRSLELELQTERQRCGALAYDQQTVLAKVLRLETEIILLQSNGS